MLKKLIKNAAMYGVIDSVTKAFTFFLWIILAWLLAPAQIGEYTLALFVIEFFTTLAILGLDSVIMRFYHSEGRNVVLSNMMFLFIPSLILGASLFILSAPWIASLITGLSDILKNHLSLFAAIIATSAIANVATIHYVAIKDTSSYFLLQIVKTSLLFFPAVLLTYKGFGLRGLLIAQLLSTLSIVILFLIKEADKVSLKLISPDILERMTKYGFPLMVRVSLGILVIYFGRILLDRYTDLATLGVYSLFLTLTLQVNKVWTSFNQAWTPVIFASLAKDTQKAKRNVVFMTFFLGFLYLLGFALFIIIGELFLFNILFNEVYRTHIHLLYILLLTPLFGSMYIACYPLYYYESKTKRILYISLGHAFAEVLLTLFLVRHFSESGAAVSTFIMSAVFVLAHMFAFKKVMQIPQKIIHWTMALTFLMGVSIVLLLKTPSSMLFLVFLLIALVLAVKFGELYRTIPSITNMLKRGV